LINIISIASRLACGVGLKSCFGKGGNPERVLAWFAKREDNDLNRERIEIFNLPVALQTRE